MLKSTLKLLVYINILAMGQGAYADLDYKFCADQAAVCNTESPNGAAICTANQYYCNNSSWKITGNNLEILIWPNCKSTTCTTIPQSYQTMVTSLSLGGGFLGTCINCGFGANGDPILSCDCQIVSQSGTTQHTTLDVSKCLSPQSIFNDNGTLTCGSSSKSLTEKEPRKTTVPTKKKLTL